MFIMMRLETNPTTQVVVLAVFSRRACYSVASVCRLWRCIMAKRYVL